MAMPSSPRLPSPPPPAEIQIGPKSPAMGPHAHQAQQIEQTQIDAAAKRRVHPGTKATDMAAGPPLIPLNELDSAFQLQEHLAALHYYHTSSNTLPITRETAKLLATPPPSIDRTLWLYELCRFLIAQCNSLIVGFLFDTPPCSAATCPEMRASEWQFLCAVHDAPKSCCAIDYCCHTLDWAANVVTNPKIFPSRFVAPPAASADGHDKGAALKNLVNVFRRLHRIFAHAWFQHRGVFWSVEGQTGLYVFFKTVCDLYDLLPAENYKLPPEAEGLDVETGTGVDGKRNHVPAGGQQQPQLVSAIATRPSSAAIPDRTAPAAGQQQQQQQQQQQGTLPLDDDDGFGSSAAAVAARTNTRRHIRSNPSTGNAISMVPEVDEEDGGGVPGAARTRGTAPGLLSSSLSTAPVAEEQQEQHAEPDGAEVPVIVLEDVNGGAAARARERETTVETREMAAAPEEEEEGAKDGKAAPDETPAPSEAEPAAVVVASELEKPVPAAAAPPGDAGRREEEGDEVGDETVLSSDPGEQVASAEPEPEQEPEPNANHRVLPSVSADRSEDYAEALAKEDAATAAAVVAVENVGEKGGDAKEEEESEAKQQAENGSVDQQEEEKASEGESVVEAKD